MTFHPYFRSCEVGHFGVRLNRTATTNGSFRKEIAMAQIDTTQSASEQAADKVRPVHRSIPEQTAEKTAISYRR
jgi:hypothetical protein